MTPQPEEVATAVASWREGEFEYVITELIEAYKEMIGHRRGLRVALTTELTQYIKGGDTSCTMLTRSISKHRGEFSKQAVVAQAGRAMFSEGW